MEFLEDVSGWGLVFLYLQVWKIFIFYLFCGTGDWARASVNALLLPYVPSLLSYLFTDGLHICKGWACVCPDACVKVRGQLLGASSHSPSHFCHCTADHRLAIWPVNFRFCHPPQRRNAVMPSYLCVPETELRLSGFCGKCLLPAKPSPHSSQPCSHYFLCAVLRPSLLSLPLGFFTLHSVLVS